MRRAILVLLFSACVSDGPTARRGVIGVETASRRDQLMLARALEEASSRAAMAFADRVQGRSITLGVQDGAKAGASLLANLLERDLLRGGAAEVKRSKGGAIQLRILLKAHGLEEAPVSDGVEITAFVDADLRLIDGRGRALQDLKLRVQKVERVDSRGFRTKVEGAAQRPAAKKKRKRASEPVLDLDSGETRRERKRRAEQEEARERKAAERKARKEEERRRRLKEAEARAEAERRADAERRRAKMQRQLSDNEERGAERRSADREAKRRRADDQYEEERKRRRAEPEAKPVVPRPQLDHATHCAVDEQILFSCKVRGAQIVSICGSPDLARRRGWLQYRFGKAKKVVRTYPEDRDASRASFTYAQEQSGETLGVQRVYWTQEERRYEAWVKQVDPFAEEDAAAAGFKLFKNGKPHRDWKCVSEYVEDLRSLDGVVLDPE